MRLPQLSARLKMTADLVPPGLAVADIGTDHAFLPVYLVREGLVPRAIAADIGEGPLRNAAESIAKAGLQDKIETRLSDGFSRFTAQDAQCWVLAGMGGTLMARLLAAAEWICRPGTVIVAQPMRHAHDLRNWLIDNGFRIEMESVCRDGGRIYGALRAICEEKSRKYGPGYAYYGELPTCDTPLARELLSQYVKLLHIRLAALQQLGRNCAELDRLEEAYHDFCGRCL